MPSRSTVSRVKPALFTNNDDGGARRPDWRTAVPVSASSHSSPEIMPARFLRGLRSTK